MATGIAKIQFIFRHTANDDRILNPFRWSYIALYPCHIILIPNHSRMKDMPLANNTIIIPPLCKFYIHFFPHRMYVTDQSAIPIRTMKINQSIMIAHLERLHHELVTILEYCQQYTPIMTHLRSRICGRKMNDRQLEPIAKRLPSITVRMRIEDRETVHGRDPGMINFGCKGINRGFFFLAHAWRSSGVICDRPSLSNSAAMFRAPSVGSTKIISSTVFSSNVTATRPRICSL